MITDLAVLHFDGLDCTVRCFSQTRICFVAVMCASHSPASNDGQYDTIRYDTMRCDSVYLTCSKKLTGSQLSPPHGLLIFRVNLLKCGLSPYVIFNQFGSRWAVAPQSQVRTLMPNFTVVA